MRGTFLHRLIGINAATGHKLLLSLTLLAVLIVLNVLLAAAIRMAPRGQMG